MGKDDNDLDDYKADPLVALGPEGEKALKRRRTFNGMIWTILGMILGILYAIFWR